MRKTNRKTWVKVTMQPSGGAIVESSWSDKDVNRKKEAAREVVNELRKHPEYACITEV